MSFILPGKSSCRTFVDAEDRRYSEQPSLLCKIYVGLLVLAAVGRLLAILRNTKHHDNINRSLKAIGALGLSYLMHKHCEACQGLLGFFKVTLLTLLLEAVVDALMPPDAPLFKLGPPKGASKSPPGANPTSAPSPS